MKCEPAPSPASHADRRGLTRRLRDAHRHARCRETGASSQGWKLREQSHRQRPMKTDENRFCRIMPERPLRPRSATPFDHFSSHEDRLLLGFLTTDLLPWKQKSPAPFERLHLPEIDSKMSASFFPDLGDVTPPFKPQPSKGRTFLQDRPNASSQLRQRAEMLRSIRLQSTIWTIDGQAGSQPHVDGEEMPLTGRWSDGYDTRDLFLPPCLEIFLASPVHVALPSR